MWVSNCIQGQSKSLRRHAHVTENQLRNFQKFEFFSSNLLLWTNQRKEFGHASRAHTGFKLRFVNSFTTRTGWRWNSCVLVWHSLTFLFMDRLSQYGCLNPLNWPCQTQIWPRIWPQMPEVMTPKGQKGHPSLFWIWVSFPYNLRLLSPNLTTLFTYEVTLSL